MRTYISMKDLALLSSILLMTDQILVMSIMLERLIYLGVIVILF